MSGYNNRRDSDQPGARYLSATAIAAVLGTSEWKLFAWLRYGRELGIRFDLLPLLPTAYEQLVPEACQPHKAGGRERLVLTSEGVEPVDVDEPHTHARIDRHWEAVGLALLTGDDRALRRFRGLSVRGLSLASDRDELQAWGDATSTPEAT